MDPTTEGGAAPDAAENVEAAEDALRFRESIRDKNWAALGVAGFIVWILEPIYWVVDSLLVPTHTIHALVMRAILLVLGVAVHLLARRKGASCVSTTSR